MPMASDAKHEELIAEILQGTSPFGRGAGHASPASFGIKAEMGSVIPRS